MKKKDFDKSFDNAELGWTKPMTIEQHPQGVRRYLPLAKDPLYYKAALQFIGGDFYRAVLGYESVWDADFEETLVKSLDFYLTWQEEQRLYYFENIHFVKNVELYGLLWRRGVKPRVQLRYQAKKRVLKGMKAIARVNKMDAPHHVDIEFSDGEIWTVSYVRYLNWKLHQIRTLGKPKNERPTQTKPNPSQDGEPRETSKVKSISRYLAAKKLHSKLSRLRQGF